MDKTDYTRQVLNSLSLETKTIKNFTSAGNVPTWLAEGELAVNIIDQKLWVGNTLNTPILLINSATTPSAQGSNTQIQFNDNGVIGAHAGLTYNKATSTLTATNIVGLTSVTGNAGTATNVAYSGLTGTVPTWNQSTTGNALTSTTAGTVTTAAQPAITSVGTLTGLTVTDPISGNITGNAGTATALTSTLAIAAGGTGQTTANSALNALLPNQAGNAGKILKTDGTNISFVADSVGSVTSVSVITANGISGTVATSTTTPAITLVLGSITPTSVNSVTLSGSSTPTLAVTGTSSISGSNTGDQINISGNAATATNVAYSGLTGTPTIWNQNTTGTADLAIALTTTLPINKGGTGQTIAKSALNALLPTQVAKSGKYLRTEGVNAYWDDVYTTEPTAFDGEVTVVGSTVTLANSAVIGKVLTGYTKSSGAIVSTDTILQAIQKLEGNVSTIDGGFPSDNYSNITTIDGGTP